MSELKKIHEIVSLLNEDSGRAEATMAQLECIINKTSLAYKILQSDTPEYSEKQLWVITYEAAKSHKIYDLL